ncbi:MAG: hypothetical protein SOZ34_06700 [Clostridia bacterium]|nr:hypothetical protein [Clostridia bacterium]
MAEHYGTKPKMFTKAWWGYFWDYYKIHTIVVVSIIAAIGITVYQVKTSPKYDYHIVYAGSMYMEDEAVQKVFEPLIDDTDNNGEKKVDVQQLVFSEDEQDAQYIAAMVTKIQLQFVTDDCMLFIFDNNKAKYYFGNESMDGVFQPTENWLQTETEDKPIYDFGGEGYAVSLADSKLLKDAGINCENLYVCVRAYESDDESVLQNIETAKKIANALVQR